MTAKEICHGVAQELERLCEKHKTYVVVVYDPDEGRAEIGFSMAPAGALKAAELAAARIAMALERKES